jgi:GAF domain-containing protein
MQTQMSEVNSFFHQELLQRATEILFSATAAADKLQRVCDLLRFSMANYDWVGFYVVDPQRPRELVLGPFSGAPTDHKRICFGIGICGQAAETGKTYIIADVSKESNYLACSLSVKSEIVVPIFYKETLVAEFDIDSHQINAFGPADEWLLQQIGTAAADILVKWQDTLSVKINEN